MPPTPFTCSLNTPSRIITQGRQSCGGVHLHSAGSPKAASSATDSSEKQCAFGRPWKYNPKVLQHWVETDESGELSYSEKGRTTDSVEVDVTDAAGMPSLVNLGGDGNSMEALPPADGGVEGEAAFFPHGLLSLNLFKF